MRARQLAASLAGTWLLLAAVLILWFGHSIGPALGLATVVLALAGLVATGLRKWLGS